VFISVTYLDVQNELIGSVSSRGISGGQRKRVNIGVELVADPTILFLDEPTSGLDSTNGLEVVKILKKVSRYGLTVLAIIHQPYVLNSSLSIFGNHFT